MAYGFQSTNPAYWFRYAITIFVLSTLSIRTGPVSTYYWGFSCLLSQTWGYGICCHYTSILFCLSVVATTCWNGTCSMLTSAKLTEGYLVVGITRELDKKPSLHYSSIYIRWSMLQQCVYLMFYYSSTMLLPQGHHAMSMCPDIILFNLCHHACTMYTPWETIVPWCHP